MNKYAWAFRTAGITAAVLFSLIVAYSYALHQTQRPIQLESIPIIDIKSSPHQMIFVRSWEHGTNITIGNETFSNVLAVQIISDL